MSRQDRIVEVTNVECLGETKDPKGTYDTSMRVKMGTKGAQCGHSDSQVRIRILER